MGKHKDYIDYFNNSGVKCPYCDHEGDAEYDGEGDYEQECDSCGKEFDVFPVVSIGFTTSGRCDKHKLWRYGGEEKGMNSYTCQVCANEYYDFHFERLGKDKYEILLADWGPE